ncbi:MAG: C2H2-type zinc finger protein [Candidatus Nanosalina sp.]
MRKVAKHECDKCEKSFGSEEALQQHKEDYDHSKLKECSTCGEKFSSRKSLKEHRKKHWGILRKALHRNRMVQGGLASVLLFAMIGVALTAVPSPDSSEGGIPEDVDKVINISAGSYYFSPSNPELEPGQKVMVRVTNQGSIGHNLRITDFGKGTTVIRPGSTKSFIFTVPENGKLPIKFECTLPGHSEQGMVGEFVSA